MKAPTHSSDLNELATGYFLCEEVWWSDEARVQFQKKAALVKATESSHAVTVQVERGRAMADCLRGTWLITHGTPLKFTELIWCARNVQRWLPSATPDDHPADLLVKRPDTSWLGISCKSYTDKEPPIKNPGLGTLQTRIGIDLDVYRSTAVAFMNNVHPDFLNTTQNARKRLLRASTALQAVADTEGTKCLCTVRNALGAALQAKDQPFLEAFLTDTLLTAGAAVTPRYVVVLGTGTTKPTFRARLRDPYAIPDTGMFTVQALGNHTLGFKRDYYRICLLRAKWESGPLASAFKFSVEDWKDI